MAKIKKENKEKHVYTVSYNKNNKMRHINVIASDEDEAKEVFNNEVMQKEYLEYLKRYSIETLEQFKYRFEFLSANKNSSY